MNRKSLISGTALTFALAVLTIAALFTVCGVRVSAAAVTASGTINSDDVNLRESASTSSKSLGALSRNDPVTISEEVFTGKKSASAKKRWYHLTAGEKTGYVRADLVDIGSYGSQAAATTDALNYRKGPATTFKKYGTAPQGAQVTLLLPARRSNSSDIWYKASVDGRNAYICGKYVSTGESAAPAAAASASSAAPAAGTAAGGSDVARALLASPQKGGSARTVYTFNKNNCSKLIKVTGYKGINTPQGLAFTGSVYYVLYGTKSGQRIVTYSADGRRLAASKFSFNMGHPNGITYDPLTGLCYIFKGNQLTIYTWDPATNKYGKSKTPYSSSGIGFDSSTNLLYASSQTGIRVYSADGAFTHQKLFPRCSHGISHYIQDCGAGSGFVFHGISGSNKHKTNYLDIYRVEDGMYLGSIKVDLGEIESAVVGNDGYLQLLINTKGTTKDHIWKTPLNVNDLK